MTESTLPKLPTSNDLVDLLDWCILASGLPVGNRARRLDGYLGANARFSPDDPRYFAPDPRRRVFLVWREGSSEEVRYHLSTLQHSLLAPNGLTAEFYIRKASRNYPALVLSDRIVERWKRAILDSALDVTRSAHIRVGLRSAAPPIRPLTDTPATAAAAHETDEAEREYPDPHDQPPGRQATIKPAPDASPLAPRYVVDAPSLRAALGNDIYNLSRNPRGWHLYLRGECYAIKRGDARHTQADADALARECGIGATVVHDGFELSVSPYDVRNARLRRPIL